MRPGKDPKQPETVNWSVAPKGTPIPAELANHPRYRVVDVLGEGGMGMVFKAEHVELKQTVAIKVIRDSLMDNATARVRFARELRNLARLTHPNIVAILDSEATTTSCFLVMEYVPGESLAQYVKRCGPLPIAEACDCICQAAAGLQHVHESGLVHRDIKPGNLMRTPEGAIKILDFGLARLTLEHASDQTSTGAILGTPAYMAPEQQKSARKVDIRADIYSLGCTLVYLLAGRPTPVALSELRSDIPAALATVIQRMLAHDAADRYQTPAEVAKALRQFVAKPRHATRRGRRQLVAAAIAIVGITAAGIWIARDAQKKDAAAQGNPERKGANPPNQPPSEINEPPKVVESKGTGQTLISLMPSSNPVQHGSPLTLTALVTPMAPAAGVPTGDVTFRANDELIGSVLLKDGEAIITTSTLKPGANLIVASYLGDSNFAVSSSIPLQLTVLGGSEIQIVTVGGSTTGSFSLSFSGATTASLPYGVGASQLQSALNSLTSIGGAGGSVGVVKQDLNFIITFQGALADKNVPPLKATGSDGTTVIVRTSRDGSASPN